MCKDSTPSPRPDEARARPGPCGSREPGTNPLVTLVIALVAVLLFPSCSVVGSAGSRAGLNTTEQMMWSTYLVGSNKGMGAGFVVFRRDPEEPDGVVPVVVTAAHLLEAAGKNPLYIGTRMPDASGGARIALIEFQPEQGSRRFYVRHPHLDIAAFEMHIPKDAASIVALPSFLRNTARDERRLRAGEEVSFLGYPEMMLETEGLFPLLRAGRVASYPVGTVRAGGVFVINADVYPGDSGAPVYVAGRRGRPELAGMIIRRVSVDRKDFSHLAIAVESSAIRETLQLLEEQVDERSATQTARSTPAAIPR